MSNDYWILLNEYFDTFWKSSFFIENFWNIFSTYIHKKTT